jgi:hypothetical protein
VLMREPELNPYPLWNAPWLFFFLRGLSSFAVIGFLALGIILKPAADRRDFACVVIASIFLSPNSASYMFILILLPLVLLLEDSGRGQSIFLVGCYVLLTLPAHPAWFFPKLWILLAMLVSAGSPYWRSSDLRWVLAAGTSFVLAAAAVANREMPGYRSEPALRFQPVAVERGEVFSSFPAISRAGLFYQAIGRDRYVLHWLHDNRIEELLFDGHALHPVARTGDEVIEFELVAHGVSTLMDFDPVSRTSKPAAASVVTRTDDSTLSPDGKWIAFTAPAAGANQVWLHNALTGGDLPLTSGHCNSASPAWELDSQALVFASDCGRGFGLPALYRARIPGENNHHSP